MVLFTFISRSLLLDLRFGESYEENRDARGAADCLAPPSHSPSRVILMEAIMTLAVIVSTSTCGACLSPSKFLDFKRIQSTNQVERHARQEIGCHGLPLLGIGRGDAVDMTGIWPVWFSTCPCFIMSISSFVGTMARRMVMGVFSEVFCAGAADFGCGVGAGLFV